MVVYDSVKIWKYYISFCESLLLPDYPRCHNKSSICQIYRGQGFNLGLPSKWRFEKRMFVGGQIGDPVQFFPSLVTDNEIGDRTIVFLICDPGRSEKVAFHIEPWFGFNKDQDHFHITVKLVLFIILFC